MLLLFDNSASYLTPESLTAGSIQFMNLYNYDYMRLSLLIYVVTLTAVWCTGVGFAAYEERDLEVIVTEVVFIFYCNCKTHWLLLFLNLNQFQMSLSLLVHKICCNYDLIPRAPV